MKNYNCYKDEYREAEDQAAREAYQMFVKENEHTIGFPMNYTRLIQQAIKKNMFNFSMRCYDVILVSIDDNYYDYVVANNPSNMQKLLNKIWNQLKFLNDNLTVYHYVGGRTDQDIEEWTKCNNQFRIINTIEIKPTFEELRTMLMSGSGIKILLIKDSDISNSLDILYHGDFKCYDNYDFSKECGGEHTPITYAKFTTYKEELINNLRIRRPTLILQYRNCIKDILDLSVLDIYMSNELY